FFVLALIGAAFVLALSGCGSKSSSEVTKTYPSTPLGTEKKVTVDDKKQFNADQQAVITAVVAFGDATAQRDYKKLCEELLTEASRKLGGGQCEQFLTVAGKGFKDFSVKVTGVKMAADGKSATVSTITTRDKASSPQDYALQKSSSGQWQVAILGQ
ncbi:MAG: hypothetical protein JHC87_08115, partial [Thermoleophilaceae bacterium]|nr:hypothetical protein [Thermoleophilaceae bacterium]